MKHVHRIQRRHLHQDVNSQLQTELCAAQNVERDISSKDPQNLQQILNLLITFIITVFSSLEHRYILRKKSTILFYLVLQITFWGCVYRGVGQVCVNLFVYTCSWLTLYGIPQAVSLLIYGTVFHIGLDLISQDRLPRQKV